ncbi:MAG: hypothetical protein JXB38_08250 [Anaerolineales bacterium]|nr:hypothetical protein [Anaerolineales bacterium]
MELAERVNIVVLVCANSEWHAVKDYFPAAQVQTAPAGEYLQQTIRVNGEDVPLVFLQTGWGKIAAAAGTQYALDRWQPDLLVNLGTCGGFAGDVEREAVILATGALVYDIVNQIGDFQSAIDHYTTALDLSWLPQPHPHPVIPAVIVSGDRDLIPAELPMLREKYDAIAGDWESGAVAYVAAKHNADLLILRGVSDLVSEAGGEAYGNHAAYKHVTRRIMHALLAQLPDWLAAYP